MKKMLAILLAAVLLSSAALAEGPKGLSSLSDEALVELYYCVTEELKAREITVGAETPDASGEQASVQTEEPALRNTDFRAEVEAAGKPLPSALTLTASLSQWSGTENMSAW